MSGLALREATKTSTAAPTDPRLTDNATSKVAFSAKSGEANWSRLNMPEAHGPHASPSNTRTRQNQTPPSNEGGSQRDMGDVTTPLVLATVENDASRLSWTSN